MTVKEIIEKYKRLAAKGKREGVTADSDEEDGGNDGVESEVVYIYQSLDLLCLTVILRM